MGKSAIKEVVSSLISQLSDIKSSVEDQTATMEIRFPQLFQILGLNPDDAEELSEERRSDSSHRYLYPIPVVEFDEEKEPLEDFTADIEDGIEGAANPRTLNKTGFTNQAPNVFDVMLLKNEDVAGVIMDGMQIGLGFQMAARNCVGEIVDTVVGHIVMGCFDPGILNLEAATAHGHEEPSLHPDCIRQAAALIASSAQ